tara:strand:- start:218 stop:574 length:357 start_codon:yes stop_codon:yes gene_type:complete
MAATNQTEEWDGDMMDTNDPAATSQKMECYDLMERIVGEFGDLKDKFFQQKMEILEQELEDVKMSDPSIQHFSFSSEHVNIISQPSLQSLFYCLQLTSFLFPSLLLFSPFTQAEMNGF